MPMDSVDLGGIAGIRRDFVRGSLRPVDYGPRIKVVQRTRTASVYLDGERAGFFHDRYSAINGCKVFALDEARLFAERLARKLRDHSN